MAKEEDSIRLLFSIAAIHSGLCFNL